MTHTDFMRRALALAGRGRTSPNPMVGAVVVNSGKIVGEGYHPRAGEPHAEVFALRRAGAEAKGATMYVTLEPCCHYGRTPPCTQAIIEAGIAEVYVAMVDPDEKVASKGLNELRAAGVAVHGPICEDEARRLNEAYIKHRTTGMPFVILKSAMSLDGKIATRTGDSKWITNERSRAYAHRIRSRVDAIVVGGNTARTDDPKLTARVGKRVYYPRRVVVTASGRLPEHMQLLSGQVEAIIAAPASAHGDSLMKLERAGARILTLRQVAGQPSIADLMRQLAEMGCISVLIEGGGEVAAAALEEKVVDKVIYFYAPRIIGGREAVSAVAGLGAETVASSILLDRVKVRRFGDDVMVEGYVVYGTD
ncbi:MAG: bifunctional diaminohydroxyphosphoribosylaminopyrimidine deaminase/5-amino-6-(5-phosphoribosylamino)uracil reductase RibD [Armatimonadetes bacterium]|nr:bifunctional diaminohydroxyphosphoribosylaminopyrimidine deaminase/5-amino-6-(5-phosphoribosylamino)uracil reductase RibD [Armatimonadota bacterium]